MCPVIASRAHKFFFRILDPIPPEAYFSGTLSPPLPASAPAAVFDSTIILTANWTIIASVGTPAAVYHARCVALGAACSATPRFESSPRTAVDLTQSNTIFGLVAGTSYTCYSVAFNVLGEVGGSRARGMRATDENGADRSYPHLQVCSSTGTDVPVPDYMPPFYTLYNPVGAPWSFNPTDTPNIAVGFTGTALQWEFSDSGPPGYAKFLAVSNTSVHAFMNSVGAFTRGVLPLPARYSS
jgi:hypothetical protein